MSPPVVDVPEAKQSEVVLGGPGHLDMSALILTLGSSNIPRSEHPKIV